MESDTDTSGKIAVLFANVKGNLGDFAILQAMLEQITRVFPGYGIDVYTHPLTGVDEARLTEFQRHSPVFRVAGSTPGMELPWIRRKLMFAVAPRRTQAALIHEFASRSAPELARFAGYAAIFMAGGDQWSGKQLGVTMFGTLSAIHRINPNIQSFPFSLKASILRLYEKAVLRELFGKIRPPLIARDCLSRNILEQTGIESVQGVDCVYSLQELARDIPPQPDRPSGRILFVVKGREQELDAALKRLLQKTGGVELLTTCPPEDERVYRSLATRHGLTCHTPMTWQDIIAEFRSSSLVITNRLHGLILGSLAEAALLPVTDRKKALAFVHDAGLTHHAAAAADISPALVEAALSDSDRIIEKTSRFRDESLGSPYSPVR